MVLSVIKLIDNGREITETDNIANTFNEYFSKLGDDLASQIPEGPTSPFSYLSNHFLNSFFISPVTAGEIEIEIANLNLSKSVGPFSIPLYVLKLLKGAISKPLEILFNASFTTGMAEWICLRFEMDYLFNTLPDPFGIIKIIDKIFIIIFSFLNS